MVQSIEHLHKLPTDPAHTNKAASSDCTTRYLGHFLLNRSFTRFDWRSGLGHVEYNHESSARYRLLATHSLSITYRTEKVHALGQDHLPR